MVFCDSALSSEGYPFPDDKRECERLEIEHEKFWQLMGGKLFQAPFTPDGANVLDLGTGTGCWAIDFADAFPEAHVIGTDISPVQPTLVPPNCEFLIDDAESEWMFLPNFFDYIHSRNFTGAIRDWRRLVQQAFIATKPGGWVEWQEMHPQILCDDNTVSTESALRRWCHAFMEGGQSLGTYPSAPQSLKRWMEEIGFENVEQHILKVPIGPWQSSANLQIVGLLEAYNFTMGLQGLSMMLFHQILGWTTSQIEVLLMEVRDQILEGDAHAYYQFYVVYGRKPVF